MQLKYRSEASVAGKKAALQLQLLPLPPRPPAERWF